VFQQYFFPDQCPYIPDATNTILEFAHEQNITSQIVELKSSNDVRELSPSPYGLFSIVYNGRLLSYHYLLKKDILKMLSESEDNG